MDHCCGMYMQKGLYLFLESTALCCVVEIYCRRKCLLLRKYFLLQSQAFLCNKYYIRGEITHLYTSMPFPTICRSQREMSEQKGINVALFHYQVDIWPSVLLQRGLFLATALLTVLSLLRGL